MGLHERMNTIALVNSYVSAGYTQSEFAYITGFQGLIIGGRNFLGMCFKVGETGTNEANNITTISVKLKRWGNPGTIYCNLYLADANHKPTGNSLSSASFSQEEVSPSAYPATGTAMNFIMLPYTLAVDTEYVFILSAPTGDDTSNCYFIWASISPGEEE